MKVFEPQKALESMDIGKSVAEQDAELDKYFIETEVFAALVSGKADVVAGDKGTGKSAIYRMLIEKQGSYEELGGIKIISAFNPTGNPAFQVLTRGNPFSEGVYRTIWKAYFLSLAGRWLIAEFGGRTPELNNLKAVLEALGLDLSARDEKGAFAAIAKMFHNLRKIEAAGVEFSLTETGMPIVAPRVEFGGKAEGQKAVYCDDFLRALDDALESVDTRVWLLLDRLDEAFVGFPDVETPALRALLRTYLDLNEFPRIGLKLFLRRDLFRRVTAGGFVNLTHINAMRIDIEWGDDDLIAMLEQRLKISDAFLRELKFSPDDGVQMFDRIFPAQIDVGDRKPVARNWIMSRIKDGNGVKPPRNLIDLAIKARENQLRAERKAGRGSVDVREPLISAESVKEAHSQLSNIRVDDTLLAEAGRLSAYIERFRDGKSEHNKATIEAQIGLKGAELDSVIRSLVDMGFLEEIGGSYKIPMLYREGLGITQGKAFNA